MDILQFYRSVLQCAGVVVNNDDFLEIHVGEEIIPITISDKPVSLPTREQLAKPSEDVILFHPAHESLIRKESPVAKQLRMLLLTRVNEVVSDTISKLSNFCIDSAAHEKASPDEREFLSKVPNLRPVTIDGIEKVLNGVGRKLSTRLISQAIRSSAKLKGEEYKRVSSITFPMINSVDLDKKTWGGVKFAIKDLRSIVSLLDYIFPNRDIKDSYSTGSHEMQVPQLHCMLNGLLPIYSRLNELIAVFDLDIELFDVSYEEGLGKLAKYKARIPCQPGNDGEPLETDDEDDKAAPQQHRRQAAIEAASGSIPKPKSTAPAASVPGEDLSHLSPIERMQYRKAQGSAAPTAVHDDEPLWKREERLRREEMEAAVTSEIPGAISEMEYKSLSWGDRQAYDRWYSDQIAKREYELQQAVATTQSWRNGNSGGYHQGGYQQGGYQQGGYQQGGHQPQGRMTKREEYELRNQQHTQGTMGYRGQVNRNLPRY